MKQRKSLQLVGPMGKRSCGLEPGATISNKTRMIDDFFSVSSVNDSCVVWIKQRIHSMELHVEFGRLVGPREPPSGCDAFLEASTSVQSWLLS